MNGKPRSGDPSSSESVAYYDENAEAFIEQTKGADLSALRARFLDYGPGVLFDGIWACASLLHVPMAELPAPNATMSSGST